MHVTDKAQSMAKQSRSKRKYPERLCANNSCAYVRIFIPHDKRQEYCCVQCRTDHNNDLRASINNTRFLNERLLRLYDKKLEKVYNRWVDSKGYCAVFKGYLEHEEIDLRFATQEEKIFPRTVRLDGFIIMGLKCIRKVKTIL